MLSILLRWTCFVRKPGSGLLKKGLGATAVGWNAESWMAEHLHLQSSSPHGSEANIDVDNSTVGGGKLRCHGGVLVKCSSRNRSAFEGRLSWLTWNCCIYLYVTLCVFVLLRWGLHSSCEKRGEQIDTPFTICCQFAAYWCFSDFKNCLKYDFALGGKKW